MKSRPVFFFAFALLAFAVTGCASLPVAQATPPLILISMDGFRWDYLAKYPVETPSLQRLRKAGVSAEAMIPVYPSNTFPNHYSIVTGLYPAHHGIINNHFFDPDRGEFFHYNQPSARASHWWGGEPIWVTALKQGKKSAASFWVGSEAEIDGFRPSFWKLYDAKIPFGQRLDELFSWLHLPEKQRPSVIVFYLEETNSIGHKFGPDSPQLAATVKLMDDRIGVLVERLSKEALVANLVIVSDHGMTPISPERVLIVEDYVDLSKVQLDFEDTALGLHPLPGTDVGEVMRSLARMPHAKAYGAGQLPPRFHLSGNRRIPPIWVIPEEGWEIERRAVFERYLQLTMNKGDHGYDPATPSTHGILMAAGPSIRPSGQVIGPVENIHVYNLLCALLDLKPAPNDGDDRLVRAMKIP